MTSFYMESMIQMNLFTKRKRTHRHKKQTYGYLRGKDGNKPGVQDQQIQTTIYKIDKQQGPTVQHRNYVQYLVITYNGKEYEKEYNVLLIKKLKRGKVNLISGRGVVFNLRFENKQTEACLRGAVLKHTLMIF